MASGFPGKRVEAQRAGITIAAFMGQSDSGPLAVGQRSTVNALITIALAVLAATFAVDRLWLLYAHKFYDATGGAQWIWAQHQLSRAVPVAFFATREFDLPPRRYFTRIKI